MHLYFQNSLLSCFSFGRMQNKCSFVSTFIKWCLIILNLQWYQFKKLNVRPHFRQNQELLANFQQLLADFKNPHSPPIIVLEWYPDSRKPRWDPNPENNLHLFGTNFVGSEVLYKLENEKCGGCYFTSIRLFEKAADGILFDITWYLRVKNDIPKIRKFTKICWFFSVGVLLKVITWFYTNDSTRHDMTCP